MSDHGAEDPPQESSLAVLVIAAIALGALVRLVPVFSGDFPINDGGLFAAFVDQLVASGMVPPDAVGYNGTDVPFAYPPAGFYLGATFAALGLDTLDVLRFLPPLLSILTVLAWWWLARALFGPKLGAIAAVFYALLPPSYEWLIAGGGLTRALGVLLVLVALRLTVDALRTGTARAIVAAGITLGLAALSHPEVALFGAASAVLLVIVEGAGWRRVVAVGAIAFATVTPWLVLIVVRYGLEPFTAVGPSRIASYLPTILEIANLSFTHEAVVPLGAILGAVGLFVAAISNRAWLIAWVAVAVLTAPSLSPALVALPWSAAAALTVQAISSRPLAGGAQRAVAGIGLATLVLASLWSPLVPGSAVVRLPSEVRQAMDWVADNLPTDSQVAVMTGAFWARDATAEWFPYLADARSVGTVQGQEFTGDWADAIEGQRALVRCASQTAECLDAVRAELFPDLGYVFIPYGPVPGSRTADCCLALRESLRESATVVHDGPGATIFLLDP